ncbi:unnamed protein product [Durusdinium trenchii]|uniref:Uncharacterized protein n=1 Tax=Durusdinium trenchii TaxID=1381693 RepID=A0ABP0M675_9DINO
MQEDDQTFAELAAKELQVKVKKHAAPRAVVSFELWEARLSTGLFPAPFNQLLCKRSSPKASARGRKGPSIHGDYISDHAEGQYFKIHCNRPRVQLQMPLLRRCWAWMFPPQPWFAPPAVTGERPSSELKVEATLQDAHVLLLEKFEEAPLISALTNMKYQLLSRQQLQEWSMNFENPEVFFSHGWTAVVDFELRAESKNRRLATAQHLAFDVATGTSPATGAGPSTERPDMQQPRCSRRLRCQELRGSLSNRDLQVWVACVKHAWGMEATDGKEENGQEESNENAVNSLEFNFNDAKVTLLSEHEPGSRWPFLELRASELCLGHLQRYKEKRLNGRAQLSLWLFNPLAAGWEPLLEGQPIDQSEPRQGGCAQDQRRRRGIRLHGTP